MKVKSLGLFALAVSLALAWANWQLLGEHPPDWAGQLPPILRHLNVAAPGVMVLLVAVRGRLPGLVAQVLGFFFLAAQVEAQWLLSGRSLVPESYWTAVAALGWLFVVRFEARGRGWDAREGVQVVLVAFVLAHCWWPDDSLRRGGHALVGAAALLSGLLVSFLWPVDSRIQ